jgi:hypothetical protein
LFSSGFSLTRILASLGLNLEEVFIYNYNFLQEKPLLGQSYLAIRCLSILDFTSSLTTFASLELPLTSWLIVWINADNLKDLRAWLQVVKFFRNHVVDLSLGGPVDAHYLFDETRWLSEVASLPGVRRAGPNWPRPPTLEPGD